MNAPEENHQAENKNDQPESTAIVAYLAQTQIKSPRALELENRRLDLSLISHACKHIGNAQNPYSDSKTEKLQ